MKSLLLSLLLAASALAQPYDGVVVDRLTGLPIQGATVRVGFGNSQLFAITDAAGHFTLDGLSSGASPVIQVSRAGYLVYGRTLRSSVHRFELTPQAVVSGQVLDSDGFPVSNVSVEVLRAGSGMPLSGPVSQLDDQGRFRIFGIDEGRYVLAVRPYVRNSESAANSSFYFPDASRVADARVLELRPGQEIQGLRMKLRPAGGVTLRGRVSAPPSTQSLTASLVSVAAWGTAYVQRIVASSGVRLSGGDGEFVLRGIEAGEYILVVSDGGGLSRGGQLRAQRQVRVEQSDLTGLALTCAPVQPADLRGRVLFPKGTKPTAMSIQLGGQDGPPLTARSDENGDFILKNVTPGFFSLHASPLSPSAAAARLQTHGVRLAGQQCRGGCVFDGASTATLEIDVVESTAHLRLKLLDSTGAETTEGVVTILGGSTLRASPTPGREFQLWVPPGEYRLLALRPGMDLRGEAPGDFLEARAATLKTVRLSAGENEPVVLQILDQ